MSMIQKPFSSTLPTNIIFGVDSVKKNLATYIKESNKSKVFIGTDPGLVKAGIIENIQTLLSENDIDSAVFSEVEPNPHAETVMKGAQFYKDEACDMILAIGGGSAMDFTKAVGTMTSHQGHILDYRRGKQAITNEIPLLFCIPTTVGTGAEVTTVSVVTDTEAGRKYVVASPLLIPKVAFVDPLLTVSLPNHVVATTGMDALVHAIEAYTSVKTNPITDGLALQAIKMMKENLPASYAHADNLEARAQVHLASTMAGMAFGIAGVGLVHSCSHPMSALHQVPHGLANAVLLPVVLEYNLIANYKRYAEISRVFDPAMIMEDDVTAAKQLIPSLKQFNESLDIPSDFSGLGKFFDEEMVSRLARDAMNDVGTIPNNPRKVKEEDVVKIYKQVLPLSIIEEEIEECLSTVNG